MFVFPIQFLIFSFIILLFLVVIDSTLRLYGLVTVTISFDGVALKYHMFWRDLIVRYCFPTFNIAARCIAAFIGRVFR